MHMPEKLKISLGKIKISKKALIQFGVYRKRFKLRDIINRFTEIYEISNRNSKEDKATIKRQIKKKINILIKEGIFRKKGNSIYFIS